MMRKQRNLLPGGRRGCWGRAPNRAGHLKRKAFKVIENAPKAPPAEVADAAEIPVLCATGQGGPFS